MKRLLLWIILVFLCGTIVSTHVLGTLYPDEKYIGTLTVGSKLTVVLGDQMPSLVELIGRNNRFVIGLDDTSMGIKIVVYILDMNGNEQDYGILADPQYNKIVIDHLSTAAIQVTLYKGDQYYDSHSYLLEEESWKIYALNVKSIWITPSTQDIMKYLLLGAGIIVIIVLVFIVNERKR
jgi:hypothetical protein